MRATDLDLMITTECKAIVRDRDRSCPPARKLMEIVKSLPEAEIEIKTNDLCQATINCVRWTSTSLAHMADQLWNPSPTLNIIDDIRSYAVLPNSGPR